MDRASVVRPIAVAAAALHLLAALHGAGPCAASARPLAGRLPVASSATTSALAVAPAATAHQRRAAGGDDDAADREGKWLPFLGAHHLPAAYWTHKPVPWSGAAGFGASPELGTGGTVEGGGEMEDEEAVRERGRERRRRHRDRDSSSSSSSSNVGEGDSTRQEQLAMWASLLNPKGRGQPAAATGWLPAAPGIGEAADDQPAKAAADTGVVEGAEGEEASAGQSYWGNNNGRGN